MNQSVEPSKLTMHETQGCLVVPIQEELSKEAALQIQRSLLEQIHTISVKGVVIDLSGVKIIDSVLWEIFSKTAQMIRMLGPPSVITGLNPGVVISIMDLNLEVKDVTTAMNLEGALEILTQSFNLQADDAESSEDDENNDGFDQDIVIEVDDDGA